MCIRDSHSTVSPSISLRLRGLAQARRARSGAPPPRLGESAKNKGMGNTGSRLSEIPLAWARRDGLAWARLTGLATVLHCHSHKSKTRGVEHLHEARNATGLTGSGSGVNPSGALVRKVEVTAAEVLQE
ncbi:hypothetical protein DEO72_LG10g1827 [Vigna unguiculata]|uniref:Uncharacterized protein n=1 Tax=Vigna unguiculata TaxID=3917 RepID=A0A4D6NF79_VIGUN|nr:hypothetical protein DEO72_LG10g1827 [Vigna unguiculata]